jgi:hypothetical protein
MASQGRQAETWLKKDKFALTERYFRGSACRVPFLEQYPIRQDRHGDLLIR